MHTQYAHLHQTTPHPCQAQRPVLFDAQSVNDSSPFYNSVKPKVQLYKGFGTSVCVSTCECVPLLARFSISLWLPWGFQCWTLNPVWGLKVETIKWSSLLLQFLLHPHSINWVTKKPWHQLTFNGRLMIDHTSNKDIKVFCFIWTPVWLTQ